MECVRARPHADIVIVDDIHTFGLKRPDLEKYEAGRGWEHVSTESVLKALGRDRVVEHYVHRDQFVVSLSQTHDS